MTTRVRRLIVVGIAAILLLLGARAAVDIWAGRRVATAVARLEQRYGPLDQRALIVPPVPAGENRARVFRAASALIDQAPLSDVRDLDRLLAGLRAEPGSVLPAPLRAFVDANREAVRVAHEARLRSESNWEVNHVQGANVPLWLELRALSRLLYLAALSSLEDGRVEDAAAAVASGLALSASIRQEPSLVAQLIRSAIGMQHAEAVQRLVTHAEPSTASLDELALRLAEDRLPRPMDVGLLGELALFHGAFARGEILGRALWPLPRLEHARYLEIVGGALDVQTGPRPRPAFVRSAPSRWTVFVNVAEVGRPGLERAMETSDLFATQHGLTELAVALRRFRLDRGHYPDSLSGLVPGYLPALPVDASTGQPPSYTRAGDGFRLRAEPMPNVNGQRAALMEWAVAR